METNRQYLIFNRYVYTSYICRILIKILCLWIYVHEIWTKYIIYYKETNLRKNNNL